MLVVVAVAMACLLPAPTAGAHSDLVATSPEQGSRLATLPGSAVLVFGGPLSGPVQVAVRGPDGTSSASLPTVDGATLEVPLTARGAGTYEISFRVTGADGHPVSGQLSFSAAAAAPVDRGSGPGPAPTGQPTRGTTGAWWWLLLLLPLGLVPARRRLRPAVTSVEDHRP
ncbi:hypothetical protein GCM10009623_35500 [Nocardioides aestuarii]